MLLINETIERFGYDPSKLTHGSVKKILVQCDYCGSTKEMKNQTRTESMKNYPKDACKACSGKKQKESLMSKYGVETTQALPHVKEKTKATNLKKFGNEEFFGSKEGKEKAKSGMVEKYGVENTMKAEEFRQKVAETNTKKYGVDNVFKLKEFQDKAFEKRIETGSIKTFDGKMIKDLAKETGYAYSSMAERIKHLGVDIATFAAKQESSLELQMATILDECGLRYQKQFRIEGKIADFLISGSRVLVEADGLYWHSDAGDKSDNYHSIKRDIYYSNGYKSLFFREDEIRDKPEILKSIIKNAMGLSTKKAARKLDFKEVDFGDVKLFIESNHLMGVTNNVSRSFTLSDSSGIQCVLQIKKLSDGEYDVARFCSASGISVTGGFSKLLKNFVKFYKPKSIQTFVDLRYGTGEYLLNLGFEKSSRYNSFRWTDGKHTFHRLRFPGNSGYESGLCKIWDCGQQKYTWRP